MSSGECDHCSSSVGQEVGEFGGFVGADQIDYFDRVDHCAEGYASEVFLRGQVILSDLVLNL
jgi:hypothetical protein